MCKVGLACSVIFAAALLAGALVSAAASDADFVKAAASGGMLEVDLGRFAAAHASDPDVRAFGQRMVSDHSKANQELVSVAQHQGLTVPSQMEAADLDKLHQLSKLRGAAFDKAYIDAMVKDHEKDVTEFRAQAAQQKSDVDRWAVKMLPTLEEHLAQAKAVEERVASAEHRGSDPTEHESEPRVEKGLDAPHPL